MIVSFYSYKGGVGRSMALANVAWAYYRAGLRVLCVDGDLEAPGLELLFSEVGNGACTNRPGFVDILRDFADCYLSGADLAESGYSRQEALAARAVAKDFVRWEAPHGNIAKYIYCMESNRYSGAELMLMTAGDRSNFQSYLQRLSSISWDQAGGELGKRTFYAWFRTALRSVADIVLFDSRTGFSDLYDVGTKHLADQVVMFCAPNRQNIDGTRAMLEELGSSARFPWLEQDKVPVLVVPSRVDLRHPSELDSTAKESMDILRGELWDESRSAGASIEVRHANFVIPYVRAVSVGEPIALRKYEELGPHERVVSDSDRKVIDLCRAYHTLASEIATAAAPERKKFASSIPDATSVSSDENEKVSEGQVNSIIAIECVDDESEIAETLGLYLTAHGYVVTWNLLSAWTHAKTSANGNVFQRIKSHYEEATLILVLDSKHYRKPYRWSFVGWLKQHKVIADGGNSSEDLEGALPPRRELRIFYDQPRSAVKHLPDAPAHLCLREGAVELKNWLKFTRNNVATIVPLGSTIGDVSSKDNNFNDAEKSDLLKRLQHLNRVDEKAIESFNRLSNDEVDSEYDRILEYLDWPNTTGSAEKWWKAFEDENRHRKRLVVRLALELYVRKATITEFFLAYLYSNTDNIQANLHYLDYTRLKKEEERKRRDAAAKTTPESEKVTVSTD